MTWNLKRLARGGFFDTRNFLSEATIANQAPGSTSNSEEKR